VESVIASWNEQQASEDAKIRLHPMQFEPSIVTFTKASGETMEDHFITKTIREHQQRGDGTTWTRDRLSKELEIDMVNQGPVEGRRERKVKSNVEDPVLTFAPQRKHTRREPVVLSQGALDAARVLSDMGVASGVAQASVVDASAVAQEPLPAASLELVDSRVIPALNTALAAKDETLAAKDRIIAAKDETIRLVLSFMNRTE